MSTKKGNGKRVVHLINIVTVHPPPPRPKHMLWYCLDCRARFCGPTNRAPRDGCARCHGRNIFDLNVSPVRLADWRN